MRTAPLLRSRHYPSAGAVQQRSCRRKGCAGAIRKRCCTNDTFSPWPESSR